MTSDKRRHRNHTLLRRGVPGPIKRKMSWANGNPDKNFNALAELQAGENRRTKGVERSTKRSRNLLSDWCPGATLKNKHTHTHICCLHGRVNHPNLMYVYTYIYIYMYML
jgi:hypothetical protein